MMAINRLRRAAVAGYFYPQEPDALRQTVTQLTHSEGPRLQAIGVIVPHAGFQYSGPVAGAALGCLAIPARCVILGPNHTGLGPSWSVMAGGAYATPLGPVPIDERLANALLEACPLLVADHLAHQQEHAIEVELPFLQAMRPADLAIVPLVMGSEDREECDRVADALVRVIHETDGPVLLVASADLTHYEPQAVAARKDAQMIAAIKTLDERWFLQQVRELQVAMCGAGPIACLLAAVRRLKATNVQLIRYGTSADGGGDPHSVIGYAGMILN